MQARDIMRKRVVTVTPNMTLREVAKLFSDRHISGAPVVEPGGGLVGVVSRTDLVQQERDCSAVAPAYQREAEETARSRGLHFEDPDYTRVKQIMTPWVISFEQDTPIPELARQMLAKRIHRVMITRDGKLCGIVTSTDILRALVKISDGKKSPKKSWSY